MSRARRNGKARKLFEILAAEITELAPREIWWWTELGEFVDAFDRSLQRAATAYVEGEGTSEELITAAEELREAWKRAVEAFTRTQERAA